MRKSNESFFWSVNDLARAVGCDAGTVRKHADSGWLDMRRAGARGNGARLFPPSAAAVLKKIMAQTTARGRPKRAVAA